MKTRVNFLRNLSLLHRIALLTYDHKSYNQYPPFHSVTCPIQLLMSENVVCYCCLIKSTDKPVCLYRAKAPQMNTPTQPTYTSRIYMCSRVIIQVGKISSKLLTVIFYIQLSIVKLILLVVQIYSLNTNHACKQEMQIVNNSS